VKKSKMDKNAIKDVTYGGISELIRNKNYYYFSSIGPNYSHWTEAGKQALQEYMDLMAFKFHEAEEESLNKRAKELVIKGLKGETV
jgi:predicted solute-binding protein